MPKKQETSISGVKNCADFPKTIKELVCEIVVNLDFGNYLLAQAPKKISVLTADYAPLDGSAKSPKIYHHLEANFKVIGAKSVKSAKLYVTINEDCATLEEVSVCLNNKSLKEIARASDSQYEYFNALLKERFSKLKEELDLKNQKKVVPKKQDIVAPCAELQDLVQEVLAEVSKATSKYPSWPTDPIHALTVLGEEFGELSKSVLQMTYEPEKTSEAELRMEAIQTAAMSLRFLLSFGKYEFKQSAQHSQS